MASSDIAQFLSSIEKAHGSVLKDPVAERSAGTSDIVVSKFNDG
jgi:hypothetical protein